jgi:hypothetical protein
MTEMTSDVNVFGLQWNDPATRQNSRSIQIPLFKCVRLIGSFRMSRIRSEAVVQLPVGQIAFVEILTNGRNKFQWNEETIAVGKEFLLPLMS